VPNGRAAPIGRGAEPGAGRGPGDPAPPSGLRLVPDPRTRLIAAGLVLVGGSPVRVLRLTPAGARQVAAWFSGAPVAGGDAARALARRLLDAGIAYPDWSESTGTASTETGHVPGVHDVTVVIPVRDRHAELARCLAGLRAPDSTDNSKKQEGSTVGTAPGADTADGTITARDAGTAPAPAAPRAPQVIIVDDASADPRAIAAIAAAHGARVIHRPVNGGPGAARNTGLAAASTQFVAFLDSDCVPAPGWLDRLLPHFADPAVGAVAPRIVPHEAGTRWLARYEGASSTLDMGARPSIVRVGARVWYVPGAALVVRRTAAGAGFADGMFVGEDVDFIWRMSAAGWRVRYEPAAVMGHDHRVTFRAWFSRRTDYGTSAAPLEQLHPGSVRPLYASWWTIGAWAAALSGRPVTAAALTGTATALLARRLSTVTGERWPLPAGSPPMSPDNSKEANGPQDSGSLCPSSCTQRSTIPGQSLYDADNSKKGSVPGIVRGSLPGESEKRQSGAEAWRLAVRLAGGGTLAAGRPIGSALSRTWWPIAIPAAVVFPRLRLPVAALILAPPLLDWADRRPPLDPARYVAARLLDDAAYSLGVWQGCLKRRTIRPLLPSLGKSPQPPH
jgi:mycofactocin glycosyltransferase